MSRSPQMPRITLPRHIARNRSLFFLVFALLIAASAASSARAGWMPVGPFGGDVRSLAVDPVRPDRMYLGTRIGQIYVSQNGGKSWELLRGFKAPDAWVVDSLIVDPSDSAVLYAGLWSLASPTGGVFKTDDGGLTWKELGGIGGQSVRALAMAPSSSKILVAGSLEGVFHTDDGGASWKRISPPRHEEIRNVESIAIDPVDPSSIYAGTWHLPWKTNDGGLHWFSVKKGIIDDSDVFSIVIDRAHSQTAYLSACSGIYRTDNGGGEWKKIQGIPYSSRRTRVLAMEGGTSETVYAGTTEGLWRTRDGGAHWSRLTNNSWIVNAVAIDPRDTNHVFLGLDQSGVMESRDAGQVFESANGGFAQRQISGIVPDPSSPGRFFASLMQDGQVGSVLVTDDNGVTWRPAAPGLDDREVLSLLLVTQPSWRLLAGTTDGIFELSADLKEWKSESRIEAPAPARLPAKASSRGTPTKQPPKTSTAAPEYASSAGVTVWALYRRDQQEPIYAASSAGLLGSKDGRTWNRVPLSVSGATITSFATGGVTGDILLAIAGAGIKISRDSGRSWSDLQVDSDPLFRVHRVASSRSGSGVFFVGGSTGLYRSIDGGGNWEKFGHGLPYSAIREIAVSPGDPNRVLVSSDSGIFESSDAGEHYSRIDVNTEMETLPIERLAFHASSGQPAFAVSAFNGLFFYLPANHVPPAAAITDGIRSADDTRTR